MPRYARAARFHQGTRRVTCADGTRTEIMDTIHRWFKGDTLGPEATLQTDGNPRGQIFWLDGVAGTGKSTIAQTVACQFHETGELGASFFCSRGDTDCSNVNMIFPTIAYQLCSLHPLFREYVSEAMRKDADLQSAFTSMQLAKLASETTRKNADLVSAFTSIQLLKLIVEPWKLLCATRRSSSPVSGRHRCLGQVQR